MQRLLFKDRMSLKSKEYLKMTTVAMTFSFIIMIKTLGL